MILLSLCACIESSTDVIDCAHQFGRSAFTPRQTFMAVTLYSPIERIFFVIAANVVALTRPSLCRRICASTASAEFSKLTKTLAIWPSAHLGSLAAEVCLCSRI